MNLESLIHACLDGEIAAEDLVRLEEILREDWQARRLYLELADLHARLLHEPGVASGRLSMPGEPDTRTRGWRRTAALTAAGIAAAVAFMILSGKATPPGGGKDEAVSAGVAMLSQTILAEFAGVEKRSGDTLAPGTIHLTGGLAQIEFYSGATVVIEGEAELEILSPWEAHCHRGRVRVQVPPAAKGFLLHAPGMKLEDLGTEFALNVDVSGVGSEVHVFDGEVIAHREGGGSQSLTGGMSLGSDGEKAVDPAAFLSLSELDGLAAERGVRRLEAWRAWSQEARRDERLIAYYDFHHQTAAGRDRFVANVAEPRIQSRTGGAVGARWTDGRWPGKAALEFKRPGDRLRMNLDGTYRDITFACWVKVDSVDKKYNSLLLTDGYENGEPHWQIYEDGSLMFSLVYRPDGTSGKGGKYNQMVFSRPVLTAESLGRWHHLAVSYDGTSGEVVQYFDGEVVGREVSPLHQAGRSIHFGPCEIGNWGLPTESHEFPIRNLNGAIDEFAIYRTALSAGEILVMFEAGRVE
jgi:hypothetical protein